MLVNFVIIPQTTYQQYTSISVHKTLVTLRNIPVRKSLQCNY